MSEPVLLALLCADRVIVEEGNHKKSIIGSFDNFFSPKFPVVFPPWFIYAAVANLSEDSDFTLNLVKDDGSDSVVIGFTGRFKVTDPRSKSDIIFQVANAKFPSAGDYMLTLTIGTEHVGSRILHVKDVPPLQITGGQNV